MRFADGARRLAGLAGALLGWAPDQFWKATPAELAAVLEAMAPPSAEAMTAADVARLKEMFPDSETARGPLHHASHGPPPRCGED